jgi:hypothetical protein
MRCYECLNRHRVKASGLNCYSKFELPIHCVVQNDLLALFFCRGLRLENVSEIRTALMIRHCRGNRARQLSAGPIHPAKPKEAVTGRGKFSPIRAQ